jgi:hypothetical protein
VFWGEEGEALGGRVETAVFQVAVTTVRSPPSSGLPPSPLSTAVSPSHMYLWPPRVSLPYTACFSVTLLPIGSCYFSNHTFPHINTPTFSTPVTLHAYLPKGAHTRTSLAREFASGARLGYTGLFISPSGISAPRGTAAGMVTPKGSMSTEGETLQVSVLPYRCSICAPLVRRQMSNFG